MNRRSKLTWGQLKEFAQSYNIHEDEEVMIRPAEDTYGDSARFKFFIDLKKETQGFSIYFEE